MRLTFSICLLSVLQSFAISTFSQNSKLSIKQENISVESVIQLIQDQTDYYFMYSGLVVDVKRTVDLNIKKKSVPEILEVVFKNTDVTYKINGRLIALNTVRKNSLAFFQKQNVKISGRVSDSSGSPLPGVTVVVKGTTHGTVTNADGNYSLTNVPSDATLVFSFVGMKTQEILVAGKASINVVMAEETFGIDEVVAIGYGTMRKSDLTGSVVSADIESFRETSNINIVQSLQGSIAGLNVGAVATQGGEPSISIRGLNTLGGTTTPLIVLDDIIYRGRIVDINPADIESVNILKDASASAIYGSQAANGVVIITTKKGTALEKPIFSYSGSIGFQTPTKLYTPMNREQFLQKNRDVWWRQAYLAPDYIEPNPDFKDISALVRVAHVEGYNDGTDTDWLNPAVRTGVLNNHHISMQTKGTNTSSFISFGYTNSKGYVKNDDFERYSLRINIDNKVLDWLQFGVQSFVSVSDYKGVDADLTSIMRQSPLTRSHNEDGSLNIYPDNNLTPLYFQLAEEMNKYLNLYGNLYTNIDVPFIKGLSYKLAYAPNYRNQRYYNYNPFSLSETGDAVKEHYNNFDYQLNNVIQYKRSFGKHSVDATFAAGREKRIQDFTSAYSGGFAKKGLDWNRLQDGSIEQQKTTSEAWQETSTFQMGRLLYNFDDRYLVTGTVRRDGFSGFGESNKFGVFPSVAVAWRINKEKFMEGLSWLDNGKLRISYGQSGNRTLQRYQTLAKMTSGYTYTFDGSSAMSQTTSTLANPDLKWESTTSFNLGLDFGIFKSRVNGTIEYYFSTTNDMLYEVDIPVIGGIGSVFTNLGEIKNRGLEFTVNSINVDTKDFTWESSIVYSRNRNEIVTLLGTDNDGDGVEDDLIAEGLFFGEPISAIYTYNVLGVYQLNDNDIPANSGPGLYRYEDLNGDGIISAAHDRKIIGYEDPSYRLSLKNTFRYKNFSLMVFINSIQGGKDYYYGGMTGPTRGNVDDNVRGQNYGVEHFEHWWTPRNPDSQFKELFAYDPVQNYRYFQRSFIRLQDVSLSYNVDSSVLNKFKLRELRVFVSGKYLYTWTDWLGLDPELGQGFLTSNPLQRNITCGLNITF